MFRSESVRLGLVALAGCSYAEALRPPQTEAEIVAECSGGSGNEVRLANGVDEDAPSLVLEEVHDHGVQPAQPTLAIWSDGRAVFGHSLPKQGEHWKFERLQGRIPASTAHKLIDDVAKELVDTPRHTDAFAPYVVTGQSTTITVRVGDRWISASVYDAFEQDFLATAAGPQIAPPTAATFESEVDTSMLLHMAGPSPPPAFSRAYRRIVETRPDHGDPFAPHDFGVVFFALERAKPGQTETAWPADLPAAPTNLIPAACDPYRTDGCSFIIDPKYRSAVLRFQAALRANTAWPYVVLDGQRFSMRIDDFYSGERGIRAIGVCGRHLVAEQRSRTN